MCSFCITETTNSLVKNIKKHVKKYLKRTEADPKERSAFARALIEAKFVRVFSAQQLEEFVRVVLQLHEDLPTKIDDKSLVAMKTNVEKNRQIINKQKTLHKYSNSSK